MLFNNNERMVFSGDSITDMGSVNPVGEGHGDNLGNGYVRVIDNMLASYYPEMSVQIINSGISGNTSRDLLNRWNRDVISFKPDYLSICIGVNDVWRQFDNIAKPEDNVYEDEYIDNMKKMISSTINSVKKLFIMTPFYIEPLESDPMRSLMDRYGSICKDLASEYGCEIIDLQAVFNEFLKHKDSEFLSTDKVHPNQIGATLIAREFLKHCDFDPLH